MNALEILRDDHRLLRRLIATGEQAPTISEREELVGSLGSHLRVHQQLEEELLFPVVDEARPGAASAAIRSHRADTEIVHELERAAGDPVWPALVASARAAFDEHLANEEGGVFTTAEQELGPDDLEILGSRIETIRDAVIR